jgi:hypothetical protein
MTDNFLHNPQSQHKINELKLISLTHLNKELKSKLISIILCPYLSTTLACTIQLNTK